MLCRSRYVWRLCKLNLTPWLRVPFLVAYGPGVCRLYGDRVASERAGGSNLSGTRWFSHSDREKAF